MAVVRVLYYLLALACLSLSAFLSYKGYLYHVGVMTPFFVAMIIIGLLMCDIVLQVRREQGDRLGAVLLVMLVPIALSGLSNFNHLYTLFMREDVLQESLTDAFNTFQTDLEETRARVSSYPPLVENEQRRSAFLNEIDQVRIQALDRLNYGCGTECDRHMQQVQAMLGNAMTNLAVPGNSGSFEDFEARFMEFYQTYRQVALDTFEAERTPDGVNEARTLLNDIDAKLSALPSVSGHIADGGGSEILQRLREDTLAIERRANALPGFGGVAHGSIDVLSADLGQIPRTFENAFIARPDPVATGLSLVFALAIDVFPVLMVLALLRPGEGVSRRKPKTDLEYTI